MTPWPSCSQEAVGAAEPRGALVRHQAPHVGTAAGAAPPTPATLASAPVAQAHAQGPARQVRIQKNLDQLREELSSFKHVDDNTARWLLADPRCCLGSCVIYAGFLPRLLPAVCCLHLCHPAGDGAGAGAAAGLALAGLELFSQGVPPRRQ